MGGVFGGLLGLIELVGRVVLYLLIGGRAKDEAKRGYWLTVGGVTVWMPIGFIIGIVIAYNLTNRSPGDVPAIVVLGTISGAVVGILIAWGLENIRKTL